MHERKVEALPAPFSGRGREYDDMRCEYLLYCLLFLLVGCESPVITDDEADMDGNLRVIVPPLAYQEYTRLNYAVYTMDGARVGQKNQEKSGAGFGATSFQLEDGDYQLVVVAHSSDGNPAMTNLAKVQFTNAQGFTDTFLGSENVTIGEEPVEVNMKLDRIAALCRFVITDDFPADAAKIRFYYTGGSGAFNVMSRLGSVKSRQEHTYDLASGQKLFDLYTFLHDVEGAIRLTVTVYDHNGNVMNERTFEDIKLQQGHTNTFSCDFFTGGVASSAISVSINTAWDSEDRRTF